MSILDYESPIVEELPKTFVQQIINCLNKTYDYRMMCWDRLSHPGASDEIIDKYSRKYHTADTELRGMLNLLRECGLHAVRLPSKPNTYIFPTYNDCEKFEDYLYEKSD